MVSIGDAGVSDAVVTETQRALDDHELIKVRIHAEDREDRAALGSELAARCEAQTVQSIGKVIVLFRANPKPDPRLSNLIRADPR